MTRTVSRPSRPSSDKLVLYSISWLVAMIVIGLRKPYAKSESGATLRCSMMFIDLLVDYGYSIRKKKRAGKKSSVSLTFKDIFNVNPCGHRHEY